MLSVGSTCLWILSATNFQVFQPLGKQHNNECRLKVAGVCVPALSVTYPYISMVCG